MTRRTIGTVRRLVVKLGSRVVLSEAFNGLVDEVGRLTRGGTEVVVVSSGAVAMGMSCLGLDDRPRSLSRVQALAAAGQAELVGRYNERLATLGCRCAQVLLTHEGLSRRRHAMNIRHTLEDLLAMGLIPLVNENDSVATEELRFGDNDRLAAAVGATVGADLVILLSDVDALYDADPHASEDAQPILEVAAIDDAIRAMAGAAGSSMGTGGMASKIAAAEIAVGAGIPLIVASGGEGDVLGRLLDGEPTGTCFAASPSVGRRRHWIGFLSKVQGTLTVDAGAVKALRERGSSLLSAGITGVTGAFERGDAVQVIDEAGTEVARGLSGYASDDLSRICGCRSEEVLRVLDVDAVDPAVHRDDMVLTPMD
ncbi:MAG: glutamate 5-kinase [Myxococcota bacterium]|jgi:glutamate 5-kinase|nr:glutamate 5-kinase [Myxococcota bacterium]